MPPPDKFGRMSIPVEFLRMDIPDGGSVRQIAEGVLWVRMPLPFQLSHINLWLLEDGDGWALVDTGINTPKTKRLWRTVLSDLPHSGRLTRLICTHAHPDHMGLVGWFESDFQLGLTTTENEWRNGHFFSSGWEGKRAAFSSYFRKAGCTVGQVKQIAEHVLESHHLYSGMPASYSVIADGDRIEIGGRYWQIMISCGHSSEHACLYCREEGILIGGDQILPKITPTIVLPPDEPNGDPLRGFLESNQQFRPLPEETLVLPGHNLPFWGLHVRLDEYEAHHASRLDMTYDACSVPRSAVDVASKLFNPSSDPHQLFFGVGEALSHIRYLETDGKISAMEGENGVTLFRQAA